MADSDMAWKRRLGSRSRPGRRHASRVVPIGGTATPNSSVAFRGRDTAAERHRGADGGQAPRWTGPMRVPVATLRLPSATDVPGDLPARSPERERCLVHSDTAAAARNLYVEVHRVARAKSHHGLLAAVAAGGDPAVRAVVREPHVGGRTGQLARLVPARRGQGDPVVTVPSAVISVSWIPHVRRRRRMFGKEAGTRRMAITGRGGVPVNPSEDIKNTSVLYTATRHRAAPRADARRWPTHPRPAPFPWVPRSGWCPVPGRTSRRSRVR